jgi:hypothetical protein
MVGYNFLFVFRFLFRMAADYAPGFGLAYKETVFRLCGKKRLA